MPCLRGSLDRRRAIDIVVAKAGKYQDADGAPCETRCSRREGQGECGGGTTVIRLIHPAIPAPVNFVDTDVMPYSVIWQNNTPTRSVKRGP